MDAQPAQSILAREVKNAKRHADDAAVEGHATLPQFEDVERVFKNRWLIEKHISHSPAQKDRKSVVWGKSVSVGVDLGGSRSIKKKNNNENNDFNQIKTTYH